MDKVNFTNNDVGIEHFIMFWVLWIHHHAKEGIPIHPYDVPSMFLHCEGDDRLIIFLSSIVGYIFVDLHIWE